MRRQPLIRQLLRREDASIWLTGVVSGGALFGHFSLTVAGFESAAFHGGIGLVTGMVVTSGFRGTDLLRRARDRRAIATQQQEIRDEAALAVQARPDPAGPDTYRWSLESVREKNVGGEGGSE